MVDAVRQRGIKIECWGARWGNGRLSQEDMIRMFSRSKINLNFSSSSSVVNWKSIAKIFLNRRVDASFSLNGPREMVAHASVLLSPERLQIKGRNFEVPGSGGFLLTSMVEHLDEYFEPGSELATFDSVDELIEKIQFYATHDTEREQIRKAGYDRALRDHTYENRFRDIFRTLGLKS